LKQEYYQLPLALGRIRHREELPKCSLPDSINRHIHLICTTAFGEMQFDNSFGCCIWDNEFDNLASVNKTRELIRKSIADSITQHEPRLQQVKVEIMITQVELPTRISGRHIKKLLDILITASLAATSEPFRYRERFFAGPLSY
jgi:phage baseplate assembly protein W